MPRNEEQAATGAAEGRLPILVGGVLCLDFANSIGGRGAPLDGYLLDYADLVAWSRYVGIVDEAMATRLRDEAERRPGEAGAVFRGAIDLRETIYRVFSAVARDDALVAGDLDALRGAYLDAMAHARLVPADDAVGWEWTGSDDALDRMLWPVARSAVELLTSGRLDRIKECPGANGPCTWLFIDTSKNAVRRWCSMAGGCGGVVKARRQTARRRARE